MIDFFFFEYDDTTGTTVPISIDNISSFNEQELEFFYDTHVRKVWHKQQSEWYLSIVDVVQVLTDSVAPKKYWSKLKTQLEAEGVQTSTISRRLKMKAQDGKMRLTDCADTEQILRIIQSIPSKKAEPFKQWLAMVGKERLDEIADPELAMERAIREYKAKGYSDAWITQRLRSIEVRKEMTDEWNRAGITESKQYAILTDILTAAWSGKKVREYKELKGLHKENLRDNMTNTELVLNQLAEISTTEISKATNPKGMEQTIQVTQQGGNIAKEARENLERQIGHSVLSPLNAQAPKLLDDNNTKK
ncbi:MAG: hypothetical protein NC225_12665 [Clostridium sp.]|nr:hypothetical protein [Clostridium sp.]MCM1459710.1 hypothetical protein [Bacteroides sp.]